MDGKPIGRVQREKREDLRSSLENLQLLMSS